MAIASEYEKKDSRVKVYSNKENLGDYNNRNKAASYAQGKYIKYLDSDDFMYPHCLDVMVYSMEQFPEAGFGLSAKEDEASPYPLMTMPKQTYLEHFYGYGHFDRAPGSSIIRRDAFEKVGRFSGERMIGDMELWFRLGRHFPMVKFPPFLYWSRVHSAQESQTDYARKQYAALRHKVLNDAFAHEDCPLTAEEKEQVRSRLKKRKLKQSLLKYLS